MKNDMRLTYPLWQMGGIVLMMGIVLLLSIFSSDGEFIYVVDINGTKINLIIFALIIFIIYFTPFIIKVRKHNKLMPKHKISINSWKPQEYMEDDEMFQEITRTATQKVYSFFVWAIPLFAGLCLGGSFDKTVAILGILFLAFCQYFIYYRTIRKYTREEI